MTSIVLPMALTSGALAMIASICIPLAAALQALEPKLATVTGPLRDVVSAVYDAGSVVAPIVLGYATGTDSQCKERIVCEINSRISKRFGNSADVAIQFIK